MGRRKEMAQSKSKKILSVASLLEKGLSVETIRKSLNVGKDLIASVRTAMVQNHLTHKDMESMNEEELIALTDGKTEEKKKKESAYKEPDYPYLAKELMKPGVTRQLLWEESRDECYLCGALPYQLTQFKVHLNEFIARQSYASLITHRPGQLIEVDWL